METTKHKIIREPKHIETVYKDKDGIIYSERIFFWEVITIKKENINRKSDFEDEYSFFTTITPIGAYGEAPLYFWSDDTVDSLPRPPIMYFDTSFGFATSLTSNSDTLTPRIAV